MLFDGCHDKNVEGGGYDERQAITLVHKMPYVTLLGDQKEEHHMCNRKCIAGYHLSLIPEFSNHYTITHLRYVCTENVCRCPNGTPHKGEACWWGTDQSSMPDVVAHGYIWKS